MKTESNSLAAAGLQIAGLPVFLTTAEVASLLRVSPNHVHRLARAGAIPRPHKLAPSRVGWRLDDIKMHLAKAQPRPVRERL